MKIPLFNMFQSIKSTLKSIKYIIQMLADGFINHSYGCYGNDGPRDPVLRLAAKTHSRFRLRTSCKPRLGENGEIMEIPRPGKALAYIYIYS